MNIKTVVVAQTHLKNVEAQIDKLESVQDLSVQSTLTDIKEELALAYKLLEQLLYLSDEEIASQVSALHSALTFSDNIEVSYVWATRTYTEKKLESMNRTLALEIAKLLIHTFKNKRTEEWLNFVKKNTI